MPRVDDDPFDQTAAMRDYKRQARAKERASGYSDEDRRRDERDARQEARHDEREHDKREREKGRQQERRRRPPARRRATTGRAAARQVYRPIRAQVGGGLRTLGLSLAVVALYLFLTNAGYVSGFLGGLSRGLEWLSSPDRSIPYRQS